MSHEIKMTISPRTQGVADLYDEYFEGKLGFTELKIAIERLGFSSRSTYEMVCAMEAEGRRRKGEVR